MQNLEKKWIRIQAYKHGGELHRMWSHGYVVLDNEDFYAVVSVRAKVIEAGGRVWHTKEPAVFFFSKKKWFNAIGMIKEKGITYYVNVASPTVYHNNMLKYIDYDLDIKLYPSGSKRLLDINEYKRHAETMHYEDDIKEILDKTVKEIYAMMDKKEFPFDEENVKEYYQKFVDETKCVKQAKAK